MKEISRQDFACATYKIGCFYENGYNRFLEDPALSGMKIDMAKATEYYREAAKYGSQDARALLEDFAMSSGRSFAQSDDFSNEASSELRALKRPDLAIATPASRLVTGVAKNAFGSCQEQAKGACAQDLTF